MFWFSSRKLAFELGFSALPVPSTSVRSFFPSFLRSFLRSCVPSFLPSFVLRSTMTTAASQVSKNIMGKKRGLGNASVKVKEQKRALMTMIELVDNRLSTGPNNGSGLRWADIPITCAFDDTSHAQYCKLYVVFFYSAHSWRLRIFTKFLLRQTGRGMHIYSWPIWKMIRQNLRTTSTMLRKAMRMP